MIRILLVETHTIVRDGLRQLLTAESDMDVAGEVGSGQEAIDLVKTGPWDVVLLELSLPDRNGIEVLQFIRYLPMPPRVVVLTIHDERQYGPRLLRMGADGFLTKKATTEELVRAIRVVVQGHRYITPALADCFVTKEDVPAKCLRHEALTDREFQVMYLLVSGKTISDIAAELSVSSSTVSTHRAKIMKKMHMRNISELIQYAIWNRLIPWTPEAISTDDDLLRAETDAVAVV